MHTLSTHLFERKISINRESLIENPESVITNSSLLIVVLYLAVFLRPIMIIQTNFQIGGYNALEIFSIVISFLLLMAILVSIRNIKIDFLSSLIMFFCIYCILSFAWGSGLRDVSKLIFPFIFFFAVRSLVLNKNNVNILLICLIAGYVLLIVLNFVEVAVFNYGGHVFRGNEYDVTRYGGLTSGSHTLAHSMFIFSVLFVLHSVHASSSNKIVKIVMLFFVALSYYCLYKTFTRTVYVGLFLFWFVYFWGTNKKYFLILLASTAIIVLLYSAATNVLFQDVKHAVETKKYEKAGSGRISIWTKTLSFYSNLSFEKKIIGVGLGYEKRNIFSKQKFFVARTHNDYLGLMITLGAIGLFLYITILGWYLKDVLTFRGDRRIKYLFVAFICAVLIMNLVSNSYVTRVELAQLFWLFAGLFYVLKNLQLRSHSQYSII